MLHYSHTAPADEKHVACIATHISRLGVLFCSEEAVARIPEPRQNISVFVQTAVERRKIDVDVGMSLRNLFYAFRRAYDIHKFYVLATALFQEVYRVARTSARSEHGIKKNDLHMLDPLGKLTVILLRLERLFVAIHTYVSDFAVGKSV